MKEELKAFNNIMELAEKLGLIEKIKLLFSKKRTVLVLGTTGVGKTSLLNSLNFLMPDVIHYLNRVLFP